MPARSTSPAGALPTFVIIGAAKCATTSLHHYLGTHPQIQVSRRKELRFFIDRPEPRPGGRAGAPGEWQRGLDWYRSWFDPATPIRGEASPGYTWPGFLGVSDRMAEVVPDAKLIYCVRDPVRRAVSQYRQAVTKHETRTPADALTPESSYVQCSRYADRLAPFLSHWPDERVLIVEQEDLAAAFDATLVRVLEFLGADPSLYSPQGATHLNASARKSGLRWRALHALRRRSWWPHVAERVPRRALPVLEGLATARGARKLTEQPPVPDAVVTAIREAVADDAARFRALTGRRFASWSV
jgi:hypothetical protein